MALADRKIAILGAGAIGASLGADLTRAGLDVVLIDQWPAHVEAMRANGLKIVLPDSEIQVPVRACHLCDLASLNVAFDVVLLAVKSYDSCWATELIKPYFRDDGVLVSVQNSLNDEWIAPIIGRSRDVACVIELSAEVFTPGIIQRNTDHRKTWFGLGELDGALTPRLSELEAIMRHTGRITLSTGIWGTKATKLINSTMMLGTLGVLGLNACEATAPGVAPLLIKVGRESAAVCAASGYKAEPIFGMRPEEFSGSTDDVLMKNLETIVKFIGTRARGVVLQDFLKGRRTEADYFNGLISRKGRSVKVATPANDAVMHVVREIERGALRPCRENLGLIEQRLGSAEAASSAAV